MSDTTSAKKPRRARGEGSIYTMGRFLWISYRGLDGKRHAESTKSTNLTVARAMLRKRVGAIESGVPITPKMGRQTFVDAGDALLQEYRNQGRRSLGEAERRLKKHLLPFFGARRMAGITTADVRKFIAHRQEQGIVNAKGDRIGDVSNGEVNRELMVLKRMFSISIADGMLSHKPHVPLLAEASPRTGFFETDQMESLLSHLPVDIRPVIEFGHITGWRIQSEVLPLEWRNVDFAAGEVRLDAGTTKNGEGRVFPMTLGLRSVLEQRLAEHETLKQAGKIEPRVFVRLVGDGHGGEKVPKPIRSFGTAWAKACRAAGCPGRIPHDLRRTAVRDLVRAGIPEGVAMKMTGHKTRSVFERYNIVSGGDLKDAAVKLDALRCVAFDRMRSV